MIINMPDAQKIDDEAHRLYFKVWNGVNEIIADHAEAVNEDKEANELHALMRQDDDEFVYANADLYFERAQIELISLSAILQQAFELALKARICSVSPFLLLLNSEIRYPKDGVDIDFSNLRTTDAVDLPDAVNSLTQTPVTESFVTMYIELRRNRNRYMHLGATPKEKIDPIQMRSRLIEIYIELWSEYAWLNDFLITRRFEPETFRYDGKQNSVERDTLFEAQRLFSWLPKGQFKRLFGQEKGKRRYICESCIDESYMRKYYHEFADFKTAHLTADGKTLECLICEHIRPVIREKCEGGCKGNVLSILSKWHPDLLLCHTCGKTFKKDEGSAVETEA